MYPLQEEKRLLISLFQLLISLLLCSHFLFKHLYSKPCNYPPQFLPQVKQHTLPLPPVKYYSGLSFDLTNTELVQPHSLNSTTAWCNGWALPQFSSLWFHGPSLRKVHSRNCFHHTSYPLSGPPRAPLTACRTESRGAHRGNATPELASLWRQMARLISRLCHFLYVWPCTRTQTSRSLCCKWSNSCIQKHLLSTSTASDSDVGPGEHSQ